MLLRVYADPLLKERLERSWLKNEIEGFLNHLAGVGYRFCFVRQAANQLLSFGEWVSRHAKEHAPGQGRRAASADHHSIPSRPS